MSPRLSRFAKAYFDDKIAVIGFVGVVLLILLAIFAPLIAPQNPYDLSQLTIIDGRLPPGAEGTTGIRYWLGTDEQGRDMFSAILYGLRTSLIVGIVSVLLALVIGGVIGLISGYLGGWVDTFIMRTVDLQLSIPTILIALILLATLGKGIDKIIIALVVAQWAIFVRIARAAVLVEKEKDYIAAAQCQALGRWRILFTQLAPNCISPLIVMAAISVAGAISLEATLSFLGLGVPITRPSLGLLISNGFEYLLSGRYWISTFPGLALVIVIVCINLVGDRLSDVLNPRLNT